ncbi:DNA-binding transcriptional LysR family regulator [Litoreibacter meonggei]|uniref:DNA-binding transcriptional LysR family regulator n=1 Tax=Litoreibacter meonggei TaxID=1049199 RepID=A0A497W6B1_9RHOB|nr:LysR family transcriptional regulator [Litoreibacter meonggei]RLJ51710.1 DNA-binding transcriptional LysR family regulator [Litoreibacter meonggei]
MNLTLRQLTTFREIMRAGSISQAARAVGRTQPAVSTMVRTLEDQLGFALFLRTHGKLIPTPEARFFLEECEDILGRLERTERTLERISSLQSGKLKIACHPAASSVFLPRLLTRFLDGREDLEVSLIMRSSAMIEDMIASQQFDIGFSETPTPRASIHQTDYDMECVCILSADDPLVEKSVITPDDLDGHPMAVLFDEHSTAIQTEAAFRTTGNRFNKRFELRTFLPGLQFVSAGLCVMVCDMITAYSHILHAPDSSGLAFRRFRPTISSHISILTPGYTTQSMVGLTFISELKAAVAGVQDEVETALNSTWPLRNPS